LLVGFPSLLEDTHRELVDLAASHACDCALSERLPARMLLLPICVRCQRTSLLNRNAALPVMEYELDAPRPKSSYISKMNSALG
jgi:hypothetical protein